MNLNARQQTDRTITMSCMLRTLGEFSFTVDGRAGTPPSTQKARALMAFLVRHSDERISRERLIEQFWPDAGTDRGRQSLSTALWSIRRTLRECGCDPGEVLAADAITVTWRLEATLDAAEFQRLACAGDAQALNWYRGEFLPGDYDEWPSSERERIVNDLETLLGDLVERTGSVDAAQRLLQIDPFSEPAYRALIEAEISAGRIVAARTLAERFTHVLRENRLTPSADFLARIASLGSQAHDTLPSAFVGRAKELAAFRAFLAGDQHVLLVLANAGFGKSTLAEKFAERSMELGYGVVRLAVRPDPQSFGGWEQIYAEHVTRSFEELLMQHGASVANALADEVLAAVPDRAIILIDDAHRLSGDAAHVTARIIAHAGERGIHIVLFARPEGTAELLKLCKTSAGPEIALEPLTREEIRAAISQRGGEADAVAAALFERTQGHPLFLGRLVQKLRVEGIAAPAHSLADERLPDSVRVLLEQRLKERGDDAFHVAGAFALDRRFTASELAAVLDWPEDRVLDALDDLLALDLVRESAQPPYLDFSHDVVAEAAREALGAHRRHILHRRAVSVLEAAESIAGITRLAHHLAAAGEAVRAAENYIRAGDLAIEAMQPRNGLDLYDRSTALLARSHSPEARRLALRAAAGKANALNLSSEPAKAREIAQAALREAESFGEEQLYLELLLLHMRSSMRVDDISAVEADSALALEMAQAHGDAAAEARACVGFQFFNRHRMNADAAHEWGVRGAQCSLSRGDVDYACLLLIQTAAGDGLYWRFDAALELWRQIEAHLGRLSNLVQAIYYSDRARLAQALERHDECAAHARRSLELLDNAPVGRCDLWVDRQRCRFIALNFLASVAYAQGNWDEGLTIADELLASGTARQSATQRAHVVEVAARLLARRRGKGDFEHAWRLLSGIDERHINTETAHYIHCARALVAAAQKRPDARAHIRAALDETLRFAEQQSFEADDSFRTLAQAARELGDAQLFSEAQGLFERCHAMRRAAAGAAWGGAQEVVSTTG